MKSLKRDRLMHYYTHILFAVFAAIWIWSGWNPADRANWFLENNLVFMFMPILVWLAYFIKISKTSLTMIMAFLALHIIGAHYGYGSVPFGNHIGLFVGIEVNSYDRFVHFFFGVLTIYPLTELISRYTKLKGFWDYTMAFAISLSFSAIYEIMEWITVANIDPYTGYLFIGGNDPFDAPKDMALAGIGALIVLGIIAFIHHSKKIKKHIKKNRP